MEFFVILIFRRLATDLLRCVPDNVYESICTPRVFEFFKIEEEAPRRSNSNDVEDDKENAKDETVRTRVSRRLSRAPLNLKNEAKNSPIDTKKRKRAVSDDDEPDSYAICQSLREQLAQTQDILNSERQLRRSLEKMLSVSTSNQNLSKRLIISVSDRTRYFRNRFLKGRKFDSIFKRNIFSLNF